jgi:hypothetical protein
MIVERIREQLVREAERRSRRPSATPTGSRAGACTAQLQWLLWPEVSNPEPWQPRGVAVVEQGNVLADWYATKIAAAWPGVFGLKEEPFYFPVEIPETFTVGSGLTAYRYTRDSAMAMIASRLRPRQPTRGDEEAWRRTPFWGWPIDDFRRPTLTVRTRDDGRLAVRIGGGLGGVRPRGQRRERDDDVAPPSVVLDQRNGIVYVVTHVDGILLHPAFGPTLIEQKEMSTPSFRRAVLGSMEYRYQAQLAMSLRATGFENAVWCVKRKETMHQAEIAFTRKAGERARVTLTLTSGQQEVYFVADPVRAQVEPVGGGAAVKLDRSMDLLWDTADVWTPYDEGILATVEQRTLRVLLAQQAAGVDREYGPMFTCVCEGTGRRRCRTCQGTGASIKTGKPCVSCALGAKRASGIVGQVQCKTCAGAGQLARVDLPWTCRYCACVRHCYAPAGVELVIEGGKPHYYVTRENFERSGLTFTPPEAPVLVPEPAEEDDEEEPA